MKSRPLSPADIPVLQKLGASTGYEYPDIAGPHMEAVQVIEDDQGKIVAAAAAKSIIELYLWSDTERHPSTRLIAVKMLHEALIEELAKLQYHEANIFLPPSLIEKFGRRLQRSFGWRPNWPSFYLKRLP
jgi:hypothetical protein